MKENDNKNLDQKSTHAEREERILAFWNDNKIFHKSLEKDSPKGDYTFYDGPPFATGLPHYGHIVPSTIKDVIPRWKTMQGYRVLRRWGWDCHGLPVENIIEKELGLKSKKDIVDFGVNKFNDNAKSSVMRYADQWRNIIPRMGRWVDMENDYRTMDTNYTETVWWIFKQLHDKNLLYESFKSMYICPRCETTLSNFEVAQGYKEITDISVIAKFKINDTHTSHNKNSESDTYLLAWTTTPWTLPGNVALAINPNINYLKIKIENVFYILAKDRISILKDIKYETVDSFIGSSLVGKSYEPIFDYYSPDSNLKNRENGWKIYPADFVTTEDGTGIVHIAPAFGTDDYELLKKYKLPFIQHVSTNGLFKKEVIEFAGMAVKPKDSLEEKDAHQKADIEIIKFLSHKNFLFSKEKIIHSYPHCWRCETPLLNYATSSWFVNVTKIKDKLISENKKITWVPTEVGSARFGNWLEAARDWSVSRSRFWGAPIPVWREVKEAKKDQVLTVGSISVNNPEKNSNEQTDLINDKLYIIGSIDDLKKYSKAKNTYHIMRHGEAQNNTEGILSSDKNTVHHITDIGRQQVEKSAIMFKDTHFDEIFISPFLRTKETMEILKEKFKWNEKNIHVDDRLVELNSGIWNGKKLNDFLEEFKDKDRFENGPEGGENYADIKKRVGDFLYEIEKKYNNKNILIITHNTPAFLLFAAAKGLNRAQSLNTRINYEFLNNAEIRKVDFIPLPHNSEYEIDLHRPYIDDLELHTPEGKKLVRVQDVFDCWFESGSMPYGKMHYPFNNEDSYHKNSDNKHIEKFEPKSGLFSSSKGYPADFIAEGLDQTRGWFYSMLVLGVALFGKAPFKKVIVNGLVLAEDGQKMSKSKNNFPDPMLIVDTYGADSLRYYLLASPVVHGQDLRFSEKGVDEITKKLVNRLLNVVSFYEMYSELINEEKNDADKQINNSKIQSDNVLDQWIISRLNEIQISITSGLESGELDRAVRPLMDFVDDLSTWYIRRSRDRYKGDNQNDKMNALYTTKYVLIELSKLLAPFMPFLAEDIYQRVNKIKSDNIDSVHLQPWPKANKVDQDLIKKMIITRDIASKGLEARMAVKINVRQPLQSLSSKITLDPKTDQKFISLIKEEVNLKEIVFNLLLDKEIILDTTITPILKEEGMVRELIRAIQELRKENNLNINDKVVLKIETELGRSFIEKNTDILLSTTSLTEIKFENTNGASIVIGEFSFKLAL